MRNCWLAAIVVSALMSAGALAAPAGEARPILEATGVTGGLAVHLGCGDGALAAALARAGLIVHGLDADAANVAKARARIQSLGLAGTVSVEHWTRRRLPHVDGLADLVVGSDLGPVPMAEVMRVVAPDGVAYVKKSGNWTKIVKPRPANIDEWTHYLRDATNNAVARDAVVGPPPRRDAKPKDLPKERTSVTKADALTEQAPSRDPSLRCTSLRMTCEDDRWRWQGPPACGHHTAPARGFPRRNCMVSGLRSGDFIARVPGRPTEANRHPRAGRHSSAGS